MAYNQAVKEFDTSDDISVEIGRYSALLGVTPLVLTNAYLKCRPAFEKIPDDVNILTWEDGGWPKQTRDCPYCPRFLFTKGDVSLLGRMTVAVAGTRNPSQEGKDLCMSNRHTRARLSLCLASFFSGMVFYAPIATYYRQARGVDILGISVIESISLVFGLLMEVPWGYFADRIGYRKTLVVSSFVLFSSRIVFWRAYSFPVFLAERLLLSFANAAMSGVDNAYLSKIDNRQASYGLYQASGMCFVSSIHSFPYNIEKMAMSTPVMPSPPSNPLLTKAMSVPIDAFLDTFLTRKASTAPNPMMVLMAVERYTPSPKVAVGTLHRYRMMPAMHPMVNATRCLGPPTMGALRFLYERHLRVPDDVSLVAYDDSVLCGYASPALTAININKKMQGSLAAGLMVGRIEHPEQDIQQICVPISLVQRMSVKDRRT